MRRQVKRSSILPFTWARSCFVRGGFRKLSGIWRTPDRWPDYGAPLEAWIEDAASGLAYAALSASSIIDFEAVLIDGAFPADIRERIGKRVSEHLASMDQRGLTPILVETGTIGAPARAKGAAALLMLASFAPDREVLFKDEAEG